MIETRPSFDLIGGYNSAIFLTEPLPNRDVVHLRAIINDNSGRFRKDLPHAMNYTEDGAFHGLGSICLPAAGASAPDHPQHPLDVSFRRDSSSLPVNDPPAFIGSASRRSTASRFTSRTTAQMALAPGSCKERILAMPMIDVYAATGTFADKHKLAQDLANAVMRWEKVADQALQKQHGSIRS